jgi:Mrp family chromosome partitioning ATPase
MMGKTPSSVVIKGINMLVKRGRDIAGVVMDLAGIGHARTTQTRMVGFQPQSGAGLGGLVAKAPSNLHRRNK